jgi:Flp pilus assembly protein TadG
MKSLARLWILCKANHGAALVELAFVTPILLVLVIGAVDFGRAYYVDLEVENAAHAGAEYGSLNPTLTAGIATAARQSAPDLSNLTVMAQTWGCECSDGSSYSASCAITPTCTAYANRGSNVVHRVQITTSAVYTTLAPWPGIPSTINLSATATVRGN